jgi:hypothetical protein
MADSIILATAHAYHAILWTQDADFRGLEGVQYRETEECGGNFRVITDQPRANLKRFGVTACSYSMQMSYLTCIDILSKPVPIF